MNSKYSTSNNQSRIGGINTVTSTVAQTGQPATPSSFHPVAPFTHHLYIRKPNQAKAFLNGYDKLTES
jgi:hypothetical protein